MKDFFEFNSKNNENSDETSEQGFIIDTSFEEELPENDVLQEEPKKSIEKQIIEWLEIFVFSVIAVVVLFTLVFRIATIDGPSMNDTLLHGQRIVISNLGYSAKQGDIVVISRNTENSSETQTENNTPIIKRVIAVGGQTVDIDFETGTVYVDRVPLDEPYVSSQTNKRDVEFPKYVPEGYVFVLGDNRAISLDSRSTEIGEDGLIDERYILGKALFRILPLSEAGRLD